MSKRKIIRGKLLTTILTSVLLMTLVLSGASTALATTSPSLGDAESFGVLGASTVTNTGPTVVNGDLGVYAGSAVTGFPPGSVTLPGTIHAADTNAQLAQAANLNAFNALSAAPNVACNPDFSTGTGVVDLSGKTLVPGVYCADAFQLTNSVPLTLDDTGNPNGVWIFRSELSTLETTPGVGASVVFLNEIGSSCNVWWKVATTATIGSGTSFIGNILASTTINLGSSATLDGRALAQTGAVNLASNTITPSICAVPTTAPTLEKSFSPDTINTGGVSTLTITLSNLDSSAAALTAPLIDTLPSGMVIASLPNAVTTCSGTGDVSAIAGGSTVTLPATRSIPASSTCTVKVDVTAATEGSYDNTLAADSLQTSNGNNSAQAIATLSVSSQTSQPTANISGMKFNDSNNNGVNDGEQGLAGWTITLSGPVSGTKITDSSGKYSFTGLLPGTYIVSETQQGGWTQTAPVSPGTHTVVLNGVDVTGKDFGNFKKSRPPLPPPPVPELPTLVLLSSGIFGLLLMLRKRKE